MLKRGFVLQVRCPHRFRCVLSLLCLRVAGIVYSQISYCLVCRLESSTNKIAPHSRTPSPGVGPPDKSRSPPSELKPSLPKRGSSRPPGSSGPPSEGHTTPPLQQQLRNPGYQQEQPPRGAYHPEQFEGMPQGPRGPAGGGHGWLAKEHQQLPPHQEMGRGWPQAGVHGAHGYYEQPRYSPPGTENDIHYGMHGGDHGGYQGLRPPMAMYDDHGMHGEERTMLLRDCLNSTSCCLHLYELKCWGCHWLNSRA